MFVGVLVALVAANVGLYLYLRPHHKHAPQALPPATTTTRRKSPFTPPKQATHSRSRRARAQTTHRVTIAVTRGPSWVLVRRGSERGAVVFEGVARAGRTIRFAGSALYVRLGAASNVDVRLDGRLVDVRCSATGGVLVTDGVAVGVGPSSCAPVGS